MGPVPFRLNTLRQTPPPPPEVHHPRQASLTRHKPPEHPEGVVASPRYHCYDLHSAILPDPEHRSVLVYLPEQYLTDDSRHFPVFYLHDGQNLFDGRTSYVADCTWRAHTTADDLNRSGAIEPVILVGVANTGLRRMAEYTPTRDWKMGGGEGNAYGRLLVEELKPAIDRIYRTRTDPSNTSLGGSSLGGLISLALGLRYPHVFGKLAVMSPSIWWDQRSILNLVQRISSRPEIRVWLDMGTAEGLRHLHDADFLYRTLIARGWKEGFDLLYRRAEGALHTENAWSARFGDVLRFLFPATLS